MIATVVGGLGASSESAGAAGSGSTPTAPPGLIVARYLPLKALTSAGVAATGVEDDGGAPGSGGFVSYARTETPSSLLNISLATYATKGDAQATYRQEIESSSDSSKALSVTGGKGTTTGMSTYVLKGGQVLTVQGTMTPQASASLDSAKANGTLTQAEIQAANAPVLTDTRKVATVAASKIPGAVAPGGASLTYIPADDVNPCTVPARSLSNGDIHVTSEPNQSDTPPLLECIYTFTGSRIGEPGTGELAVYTLSGAQAKAAIPSTSVPAIFASIAQSSSGASQGFSTAKAGQLSAEGTTSVEPDYVVANVNSSSRVQNMLIQVEDEASSFVVDESYCKSEIVKMFFDLYDKARLHKTQSIANYTGTAWAGESLSLLGEHLGEWCAQIATQNERPPPGLTRPSG